MHLHRPNRRPGVACVASSLMLLPLIAAAQFQPRVSVGSATLDPAGSAVVDITYTPKATLPALDIYQLVGEVSFDSTRFTASAQAIAAQTTCTVTTGRIAFSARRTQVEGGPAPSPYASGPLCRVTFTASALQATRDAQPLTLRLDSCNDEWVFIIGKASTGSPKVERSCATGNGSLTVRQAQFASTPPVDGTILVETPVGGTGTAELLLRNDGSFGTTISLSGLATPLSVSPASVVLAAGAEQTVTVTCAPDDRGEVQGVLNAAITHDPDRTAASYDVHCDATVEPANDIVQLSARADGGSLAARSDSVGRYVVMQTDAGNLGVSGKGLADGNGASDIYRIDTTTGLVEPVSVDMDGVHAGGAIEPSVDGGGHLVVFVAPEAALGKLHGEKSADRKRRHKGAGFGIFLRDMLTGTTQRVGPAMPQGEGTAPVIAPGGDAIVYTAPVADPAEGTPGQMNVYRVPLPQVGAMRIPGQPRCISCKAVSVSGPDTTDNADGDSRNAVVSADGRQVAFETLATNSTFGNSAPCSSSQIMLRDMLTGVLTRVSPPSSVAAGGCGSLGSATPSIDHSARRLAFESDQPLQPGSLSVLPNVFVTWLGSGLYQRGSETSDGGDANGGSSQPVLSGDGRTLAFVSAATNLDASFDDGNGVPDLHARRLDRRNAARLSRSLLGIESVAAANRPALNYNATLLLFDSTAGDLVPGDGNGFSDVFRRRVPDNAFVIHYNGFD